VGLLFFGRRLPEVGRNIGKTVVEFRKGIKDIEREVEEESAEDRRRELPSNEAGGSVEGTVPREAAKPSEA
jgi:sec-independent protein translocase protein TatA